MPKTKLISPLAALRSQCSESPLTRLMGAKGLTQLDLAEALDVSTHTISNWVNGKTEPHLTLKEWDKLSEILGTTIDKLPRNFASDDEN